MNASRQVLMQAVHGQRTSGTFVFSAVALTVMLGLAPFAIPVTNLSPQARERCLIALCGIALTLVVVWWCKFITSVVCQNTPANARLIPGYRDRLLKLVASVWAVAVCCLTAVFCFAAGNAAAFAIVFGLLLAVFAQSARFPVTALCFSSGALIPIRLLWAPFCRALENPLIAAAALGLSVAIAYVAMGRLILNGGDEHAARQRKLAAMPDPMHEFGPNQSPDWVAESAATWEQGIGTLALGYRQCLRRDCARRAPPARLLAYLFGSGNHWSTHLLIAFCGFLLVLTIMVFGHFTGARPSRMSPFATAAFASVTAVVFAQIFLRELVASIYRTKNEQRLLRLCPAVPQGAALNRAFAETLLRATLACTGFALVAATGFTALHELSTRQLPIALLALGASVFIAGHHLRSYAAAPADQAARLFLPLILIPALMGAVLIPLSIYQDNLPLSLAIGAACVLMGLAFARYRWRAMVAAPVVFPVERLA
ncbi:MAG: hypothetical protein V4857_25330 [Pseudomonadota bacterium]